MIPNEHLLAPGTKVTLELEDIDGDLHVEPVTVVSDLQRHGYRLALSGGWGLYGNEGRGDRPSYRIAVKKKGRRKAQWVQADCIRDVSHGWS